MHYPALKMSSSKATRDMCFVLLTGKDKSGIFNICIWMLILATTLPRSAGEDVDRMV